MQHFYLFCFRVASPHYERTLIRIYFYFLSCASFLLFFLYLTVGISFCISFVRFHLDRFAWFFVCFIRCFGFSIHISILELNVFTYKYKHKLAKFCWITTKRWTNHTITMRAMERWTNFCNTFSRCRTIRTSLFIDDGMSWWASSWQTWHKSISRNVIRFCQSNRDKGS